MTDNINTYTQYIRYCDDICIKLLNTYDRVCLVDKFALKQRIYSIDQDYQIIDGKPVIKNKIKIIIENMTTPLNVTHKQKNCSFVLQNEFIQLYVKGYYLDNIKRLYDMFLFNHSHL